MTIIALVAFALAQMAFHDPAVLLQEERPVWGTMISYNGYGKSGFQLQVRVTPDQRYQLVTVHPKGWGDTSEPVFVVGEPHAFLSDALEEALQFQKDFHNAAGEDRQAAIECFQDEQAHAV